MTGETNGGIANYDRLFRNALIFDGSGKEPFLGEVAITGERIAFVGPTGTIAPNTGAAEEDLAGLALAPGFIDSHTHDDRIVLDEPDMLPKISQGVTTVVVGNCGISLVPVVFGDRAPPPPMTLLGDSQAYEFRTFADYASRVNRTRPSVNVAALIGHSALRLATMADIDKRASDSEIAAMCALAEEAMDNGATGMSTGLFYPANAAADIGEVASIAARFAQKGGVYATHMRDEFDDILASIDETLETAAKADIPVVISHHKCAGVNNWGRTRETLPKIEQASDHQPVNLDAYPYSAGSTYLRAELVTDTYPIHIAWSQPHPDMQGRALIDIASEWNVDLLEAARRLQPAGAIYFQMDEADVRRVLASRLTMIGSDGLPHDAHPHPRLWGTFPRVIGHYARDEGLFTIQTAIHKMTGLTARVFRLRGRGEIRAGAFADLVVFDPSRIIDKATYDKPLQYSEGIYSVFVNGVRSYIAGRGVVQRAGRIVGGNSPHDSAA
ncbi:N-acyl-D-amino-acid deacylase family protein [Pseudaminobacter soli (ex Li et al. 2025)]|uniref:D-aminoacylase n=1 Tax=Pseudaminobacter soli (ex Li et al. 2025) TaxID=1295366 RepID=A0A2P7S3Q9_9HYPH|nr:D-aminoacylase [Mesorhizobium soli]PSJ57112.1 D-aminoacylase [Mesorhizobium soli]